MFCIVAFVVLGIMGIFSATNRGLAKEAFDCVLRRVTLRPCTTGFDQKMNWQDVKPVRQLDYLTQSKNNGNNVDLQEELMSAEQNQMMYSLMAQAAANEFNQLNIVLKR